MLLGSLFVCLLGAAFLALAEKCRKEGGGEIALIGRIIGIVEILIGAFSLVAWAGITLDYFPVLIRDTTYLQLFVAIAIATLLAAVITYGSEKTVRRFI